MASAANPEPRPKLTVAGAAERVPCSQRTIRNWITAGLLPAEKVGPRMIRIDPRDLDRLTVPARRDAS
jgi:excisionase family DNA binding protein